MDLDLGLANSYLVLVQEGHYGRAAARLHLTGPALTKRIQRLERQLGTPLLTRSSAGVVGMTEDGRRFAGLVGPLLRHAETVCAATRVTDPALTVRVGVPAGARRALRGSVLSNVLGDVRLSHPGTTFVVVDVPFPSVSSSLPDRRVDVLWTDSPVPHRDLTSVGLPLSSRRIGVVGAEHPLAAAGTLDVGVFADEPMLWNPAAPREWMRPFWLGDLRPHSSARLVSVDARDHAGVFRHVASGRAVTVTLEMLGPFLGAALCGVVLTGVPAVRFYVARRRTDSRDAVLDLVRSLVAAGPSGAGPHPTNTSRTSQP